MSRIAVVTSSPPMVEGGHMVIARSLVQALREAGHSADIIVTPQNRFGRQASAYVATWLTDVGVQRRTADRPGDQPPVSQLRGASSPPRLLAESHHARVLRPVAAIHQRPGPDRAGEGECAPRAHPARGSISAHAERAAALRPVAHDSAAAGDVAGAASDGALPAATAAAVSLRRLRGDYVFMVSRLTPLKRADLFVDALSRPEAAGIRAGRRW